MATSMVDVQNAASAVHATVDTVNKAVPKVVATAQSAVNAAAPTVQKVGDVLADKLLKAMDATGNAVDKAVDFVMEQTPLLVQEVLHWYFAYYLIMFILGFVVVGALAYLTYRTNKWIKSKKDDDYMVAWLPIGVINLIGIVVACDSLFNLTWLKIYIAPRLWLIEYTTQLVKHATH